MVGWVDYNKNPCAWLLWHWSSRGQLALCNPRGRLGRVGSKFNWPSEDQCQRSHSKWFLFISHTWKVNIANLSSQNSLESRRSVLDNRQDGSLFWCVISGPRDWTLRDWSRTWPTLTWLAKLVGVSVSSSVGNTNFPHTLKPWNTRASVG